MGIHYYPNNPEFYADFETVEKNEKNLLTKVSWSKQVWKLEFVLFYIPNLQRFLANNFFLSALFPIISTD
jgi:hypothetical protein